MLKVITRDLFICLVFYAPRWRNYCDLRDTYAYVGWLFPHWPPHAACDCKINNFSAGNYLSRSHLKICLLPSCVYYTAKKIPQPTNIASKSSVPFDAPSAPRASVDVEMQMKRARAAHHSLATIRQMKEDRSHLTEQIGGRNIWRKTASAEDNQHIKKVGANSKLFRRFLFAATVPYQGDI